MNKTELDKKVKEFVEEIGVEECKKAGLAAMMSAFYCGMHLDYTCNAGPDEVANDLGLSSWEYNYWDDLYYKKNSWFNKLLEK